MTTVLDNRRTVNHCTTVVSSVQTRDVNSHHLQDASITLVQLVQYHVCCMSLSLDTVCQGLEKNSLLKQEICPPAAR